MIVQYAVERGGGDVLPTTYGGTVSSCEIAGLKPNLSNRYPKQRLSATIKNVTFRTRSRV